MRAGLPVTVPGMTIDRQCSSGLMAIATAAKQVIVDRMEIVLAGGVEVDLDSADGEAPRRLWMPNSSPCTTTCSCR